MKLIFHWNAYLLVILKSLLKPIPELSKFLSREKSEMSSANNLGFDTKSLDKSLKCVSKNNGPRIEIWGTPASTSIQ